MRNRTINTVVRAVLLMAITGTGAHAQSFRARVGLLGFEGPIALDTMAVEYAVTAAPGAVVRALDAAFKDFNIPMTFRDSAGGVVGNVAYKKTRSFANAQGSKWLNCGSGMTGPNADEMRLTVALIALVDPGPAGSTKLRIGMAASAEDVVGQSRPVIPCGTTGRLEAAIAEFVKKQTGG